MTCETRGDQRQQKLGPISDRFAMAAYGSILSVLLRRAGQDRASTSMLQVRRPQDHARNRSSTGRADLSTVDDLGRGQCHLGRPAAPRRSHARETREERTIGSNVNRKIGEQREVLGSVYRKHAHLRWHRAVV